MVCAHKQILTVDGCKRRYWRKFEVLSYFDVISGYRRQQHHTQVTAFFGMFAYIIDLSIYCRFFRPSLVDYTLLAFGENLPCVNMATSGVIWPAYGEAKWPMGHLAPLLKVSKLFSAKV